MNSSRFAPEAVRIALLDRINYSRSAQPEAGGLRLLLTSDPEHGDGQIPGNPIGPERRLLNGGRVRGKHQMLQQAKCL